MTGTCGDCKWWQEDKSCGYPHIPWRLLPACLWRGYDTMEATDGKGCPTHSPTHQPKELDNAG